MSDFYAKYNFSYETQILLSLCFMLLAGFLITRITKRLKFPNVTGFIIAGIIIGPSVLGLIPQTVVDGMGFVSDIAMTFIAFSVGKFFTTQVIKKGAKKALKITLFEVLITVALMMLTLKLIFGLDWAFVVVLSILAIATAPASTMLTIQQYNAKGDFVETLLQVIAYGNVICIFAFGVATSIINSISIGAITTIDILLPILYNLGGILLGFVFGIILGKLLSVPTRSFDNRLILLVAMLLGLAGICSAVSISADIACMVFGATYINFTKDKKLYKDLTGFTPPIMSIFFILGGMNLKLASLKTVGIIGVVYTLVRFLAKYVGSVTGSVVAKSQLSHKKYLGLGLIPQAGVAIGLAFLAQRVLPTAIGDTILTIILASSVLYELIGPACAKASLVMSGSIKTTLPPNENSAPIITKTLPPVNNYDIGQETLADIDLPGDHEEILENQIDMFKEDK
ncbi:MAG: cation:proton antiporter [Clostridiales bacterium]|nr:cation:proton antiporter [Clostridiales bacterium]